MNTLNKSKTAIIAHFGGEEKKEEEKKIETLFQENIQDTNPVASMNTTAENNSHKIDLQIPEEVKSIPPVAIMNTTTDFPTYEKVMERMDNFVRDFSRPSEFRGAVFNWMSEYSLRNHARMVVIASKLCAIKEDYYHEDFDVPEETKKEIFNMGCEIDREGGKTAQQACFYIAINFIEPTNKRIKAIECCWHGAGSWRY